MGQVIYCILKSTMIKTDKFLFVSLFLLERNNCDLQMKSYTDSCAVYLGTFDELSVNVLRCSLNKIESDKFEKKHNNFLYKFCNTKGKCLEVSYMDWGGNVLACI